MKAVVLFSGGLDSTVLLAQVVHKLGASNVIALSIFYGQRHQEELKCAQYQINKYGVEWIQLNLSSIFVHSDSTLLSTSDKQIPTGSYKEQLKIADIVSTYIPYRNGLFLSVAASIAYSKGAETIYYGAHLDDASPGSVAYPDCSKEFVDAQSSTIFIGTGRKVTLKAPFVNDGMMKANIVESGSHHQVDFKHTWSCYDPQNGKHCGKCATCLDRKKAFSTVDVEDPTEYAI